MGRARDQAGNIWETDAQGNAVRLLSRGGAPAQAVPSNPVKQQAATASLTGQTLGNNRTVVQTRGDMLSNVAAERNLRQNPISPGDQARINEIRASLGPIDETLQMYGNAARVVDRFGTGPTRAARVRSAVPAPDAGLLGALQAGFMQRVLNVPEQDIQDYQELERLTNLGVAQRQAEQKGPQTESDALRYRMAGLSPDKAAPVNANLIGEGILQGLIAQQRPAFYTKWANDHGSLSALANGMSVDEAWQAAVNRKRAAFNADPRIRRIRGAGASGASTTIRYDREGNRIK